MSAQTRQELGVANVEHPRLSSTCDALQTGMTAVRVMMYKLQIRSPELIDEFFTVVEQLWENQRRFVAADVVLRRVFNDGFTSSYELPRAEIAKAINAEMDNFSAVGRQSEVA